MDLRSRRFMRINHDASAGDLRIRLDQPVDSACSEMARWSYHRGYCDSSSTSQRWNSFEINNVEPLISTIVGDQAMAPLLIEPLSPHPRLRPRTAANRSPQKPSPLTSQAKHPSPPNPLQSTTPRGIRHRSATAKLTSPFPYRTHPRTSRTHHHDHDLPQPTLLKISRRMRTDRQHLQRGK